MNTKKRNSQKTRKSIIKAAVHCYMQYGVQNSSLDVIAEKANTTRPTIYAHFGSKDKLFDAVLEDMASDMLAEENFAFNPVQDPIEQLIEIFDNHLKRALEPVTIAFVRAAINETIRREEDIAGYDNSQKELHLRKWFQDAQGAGVLRTNDIITTTNNLLAITNGRFYYPALVGLKKFSHKEQLKELSKSIKNFIEPLLTK